jgi:cell fate regulator YaaT (PSP1 superfamily)
MNTVSDAGPLLSCPVKAASAVEGTVLVILHPFRTELTFAPRELGLATGDWVVFRNILGEDLGRIIGRSEVDVSQTAVIRRAVAADLRQREENTKKAEEALATFRQLVRQFRLPMKPVGVHLRFDRREIWFYFISDERLNFRALHKAVSSALNTRVSIRQVGVRDYARVLGGIGPCGRVLCCHGFLTELKPITLRMARQQSLFVEPAKISGLCGKLLCCLGFEESGGGRRTERGKGRKE